MPIIPAADSPDEVPRYWVQLEGIALSPPGEAPGSGPYSGSRIPVFLDSGATLTLLPPDLAAAIASDFGAAGEDENGFYPVDCGLVEMEGSLDFAFEGVTVRVPYREMIRELRNPPSCYLGIVPSEDFTLLGDTFLRSAYGESLPYLLKSHLFGLVVIFNMLLTHRSGLRPRRRHDIHSPVQILRLDGPLPHHNGHHPGPLRCLRRHRELGRLLRAERDGGRERQPGRGRGADSGCGARGFHGLGGCGCAGGVVVIVGMA